MPRTLSRFFRSIPSIVLLYIVVATFYFLIFGKAFLENLEPPTWLIAPIMFFGSFVAGSTFLGGGAVAFPALTKILSIDPVAAKTFSLFIQSVGMSAASIYIIARVRTLPILFISLYTAGASVGIFLSLAIFEQQVLAVDLRISFTLFLSCFLGIYYMSWRSCPSSYEFDIEKKWKDTFLTLSFGLAGGGLSGLIGSGADLIGFCLLTLYFKIDIKRATQISILLMAATSLAGTFFQIAIFAKVTKDVLALWYVAAPIVLFGAPLGAYFCRRVSPSFLLFFISTIVCLEFVSTLYIIKFDLGRVIFYGLALLCYMCVLLNIKQRSAIKLQRKPSHTITKKSS